MEKQPETVEKTEDSGTIKEKEYEGIPKNWKKLEGTDDSLKSVNRTIEKEKRTEITVQIASRLMSFANEDMM